MEYQIIGEICVVILSITVCPFLILSGARKLVISSNVDGLRYAQVRRPNLVYNICIISCVHLTLERPFIVLYNLGIIPNKSYTYALYQILPSLPILGFIHFLRVWMLYFDTNIKHATPLQKKKSQISKSLITVEPLCQHESHALNTVRQTVANAQTVNQIYRLHTYGSDSFMTILLGIPCIIFVSIHLALVFFLDKESSISIFVNAFFIILPLTFAIGLLYKVPSTKDPFFIKTELLACACTLLSLVLLLVIITSSLNLEEDHIRFFNSLFIVISITLVCSMQTHCVIYYFLKPNSNNNQHQEKFDSHGTKANMMKCLQSIKGFTAFHNHLRHEFSSENLMFFVEAIKYKHILEEQLHITSASQSRKFIDLEFDWVAQPDDFNEFFCKMYALHISQKYITDISQEIIHVNPELRDHINVCIEKGHPKHIPYVFDQCLTEVWLILQEAFVRFKNSKHYKDLPNRFFRQFQSSMSQPAKDRSSLPKANVLDVVPLDT